MRVFAVILAVILAVFLALLPGPSARADVVPPPDPWTVLPFLTGHWRSGDGGAIIEEVWLAPEGNLMLGMSRTVKGLEHTFEFLRIERRKSGIVYVAQPGGGPATEFLLQWSSNDTAEFRNESHDFPQTIRYQIDGEGRLSAILKGTVKGKPHTLQFRWTKVQ
jgi:hypothetical protein